MPVKNAMPYLIDCMESIINQTAHNWQLIAINDHSVDESFSVLKQYAEQDSRIKVYNNNGKGIIEALRLALSKSKGDLITRMDADDKMAATKIVFLKDAILQKGKGHIALGAVEYFSETGLGRGYQQYANWLNHLTKQENNFKEIYKECVIPSPCWMVFKDDLLACGAFEPNVYPEDYDLCFRFYEAGLKIVGISEVLHYWRDYPSRTSRTDAKYTDNRFLDLKLGYFLKLDHLTDKKLVLWGAGDKGKYLAKQLIQQSVDFGWICNNPKKIGHFIYGKELKEVEIINPSNAQFIIAVAQRNSKATIGDFMLQNHLEQGKDYFYFC